MTPRKAALAGAMFLFLHGCGHAEESKACQVQPDTGAVDASSETNDPCCPPKPIFEVCEVRGLICRYPCGLEGFPISRVDIICTNRGDGLVQWQGFKESPCP